MHFEDKIKGIPKSYNRPVVSEQALKMARTLIGSKDYLFELKLDGVAETMEDTAQVAVSRYILGQGRALYSPVEKQELEGVVAKRLSSLYFPGKRTKDWIKMKRYGDEDFVICFHLKNSSGGIGKGEPKGPPFILFINGKMHWKL